MSYRYPRIFHAVQGQLHDFKPGHFGQRTDLSNRRFKRKGARCVMFLERKKDMRCEGIGKLSRLVKAWIDVINITCTHSMTFIHWHKTG